MKIGIVEDNQSIREMLTNGLLLSGVEVVAYANAQDCIRAIFQAAFNGEPLPHDIIVTDLHLNEGIDGIEMIRRIRQYVSPSELPFCIMSGRELVEQNLLTQNLLDIQVLRKPLTVRELLKEIKRRESVSK